MKTRTAHIRPGAAPQKPGQPGPRATSRQGFQPAQLTGNLDVQRRARLSKPHEPEEHRADDMARRFVDSEPNGPVPGGAQAAKPGVPAELWQRYQRFFGGDLADVEIHAGPQSGAMARAMGARAFTVGKDVHLDTNVADVHSREGQRTLAHELAHATSPIARAHSGTIWRDPLPAPAPVCEAEPPQQEPVCRQDDNALAPRSALPEPGANTVTFGGRLLSPRSDYLRWVLGQIGAEQGYEALESYVSSVEAAADLAGGASTNQTQYTMGADNATLLVEIAPLLRGALNQLQSDIAAFGRLIINAAVVRLRRNHHNLGLWSDYVASLAPREVTAMTTAAEEHRVLLAFEHSHARGPFNPMDLYEQRAWSTSRFQRDYFERLGTGEIHGGCQQCHEMLLAQNLEYASLTHDEARIPLAVRMPAYARLNAGTAQPPSALGPQPQQPPIPDWTTQVIGDRPGAQAIAQSLMQIRNYLLPLGDAGYRIITRDMLFNAQSSAELIAAVQAAIAIRRQGYLDLIAEMESPGYDYLEPLAVLQQLLPLADRDVRAVLNGELRKRQADAEARAEAGFVLGIAALLLSIFPPTAPLGLAMAAGLGTASIVSGYQEWEQGQRFEEGTGAGVFTREQENAAREMQAMGIINMALGALNVATAGLEVVNVVRTPVAVGNAGEAIDEVVAIEAQAGGTRVRVDGLGGDAPTATITQPDGTVDLYTGSEVKTLAEPKVAEEPSNAADPMAGADEFADFQQMLRDEGATGPVQAEGDITQLQPHAAATRNRTELGVSGRQVQSAHGAPQSVMSSVAGYNPEAALTRLMDRATHTGMDQYWKQTFQAMRRAGRTQASASEIYDVVAESIRRAPGLPPGEANSLIARLSDEMFVEYGLQPADMMLLPYPNIHP